MTVEHPELCTHGRPTRASLGISGPEQKLGFRTVKPKTRALSGAFGSKLAWEMCSFWGLGGGLHLFQNASLAGGFVLCCAHLATLGMSAVGRWARLQLAFDHLQ